MEQNECTVRDLQRVIRDLVSLATIPASWVGREPTHLAESAASLVLHTLRVDASCVCIASSLNPISADKDSTHPGFASTVRDLQSRRTPNGSPSVETLTREGWPTPLRVMIQPIGIAGEFGFIAAGCASSAFPSETDSLLLSLTANQLSMAIQTARLIEDRRASEQVARESEGRFRAIVDTTPECVKLVARDGTLLHMNSAGLALVEANAADTLVGRNVYDLIAPEDRDPFRSFNERVCDGERGSLQFEVVSLKGTRRKMETRAAPFRTADGSTVQLAITHDVTERSRAEHRLRQSERKFRDFVETSSVALHFVGPDGIIEWANQAELDLLGYTADEYLGHHIAEFHVDAPTIDDILTRLCRGQRLHDYEARLRAKDGSIRHVLIDSSVLFEDERFVHTRCFTRDITERKLAETALRESEQRFRVITDASPIMVWMAGTDKLCFYFNKGWLDFVGQTLEHEAGNGWTENVHPDDFERCLQIYVTSFDARQPFEMEYRLKHHSGQYRWIVDHGVPRYSAEGAFEGYVGGCLDIHEQREAAELRHRLAAIVESSEDAIISMDLSGIVTSWNRGAETIFGYTAEEMMGQPILKIIPPELHADEGRIWRAINRGESIQPFEIIRVTKDGRRMDVSLTVSPVRDHGGRIIGAAKIVRDISEKKNAERALRTTERLAAVGRLAATVAHEINNPLEAVTNLVYLAKGGTVRADIREFLTHAEEELERIAQLTKQTLGFYRETKGVASIRMGDVLGSFISVFAPRAKNKDITLQTEVRADVVIEAVPGEIRQLIGNLVANSIDAVAPGGRVTIRVSAARRGGEPGVRLTVADDGHGIPDNVRSHLFQPFFTTKRDVGTGLGLWVCKSIVEKHQGLIRLRTSTTFGRSGTVFSIVLPCRAGLGSEETLRQAV
ncbi:MAG TPA: PAS domain S-box protein [Terriglobales bacterium]|nr:PAS domain S-box protein [Terriglobales bacterium]